MPEVILFSSNTNFLSLAVIGLDPVFIPPLALAYIGYWNSPTQGMLLALSATLRELNGLYFLGELGWSLGVWRALGWRILFVELSRLMRYCF